ncbi:MAG: hypothetical protein HZA04_02980 [Nitrospinae bacterium]|nr:hypothetical protein [Nitrospinota bacterium]
MGKMFELAGIGRDFIRDIKWARLGGKLLDAVGMVVVVIVSIVGASIQWLITTVASAAVWFAVWVIGFAITFLFIARFSGFKFTKLMGLLS